MRKKNLNPRCWFVIILLILQGYCLRVAAQDANPDSTMYAHFIDVGQADATLLEFPGGTVLIDAGAQDADHRATLLRYLRRFFEQRPNLNNTLDLVVVTHNHLDHNSVLDSVATQFRIRNYIDNGMQTGSGKKNQLWLERNAAGMGIVYKPCSNEEATASGSCAGLSDSIISPIKKGLLVPRISILAGRFLHKPANWSATDFNNGNNHSLVIKVVFGKSSFLFTGDLETKGLTELVKYYGNCAALDVDILRVGHHGAGNGFTIPFLRAVTPAYAMISCGTWNYGIGPPARNFTTFAYGHPSRVTLTALNAIIPGDRLPILQVKAGLGGKKFTAAQVMKNVYATPWDHNIVLEATSEAKYTILK